ncbi:MAG TPA: outer membrane beta-barrel protein [Gammaproteobacteria bacterium]|jgi:opacity protein-like surface antigen|nr:outer membrane beta-barrel protein [Gammaproteobacteria bacterium]
MKYQRLSAVALAISAVSALAISSTVVAATHHQHGNYKGENYKGEAMAVPCPPPKMLMSGVYLGAQVGYDYLRVRESFADVANPPVAATGWLGGLFLGYGQYLTDLFYLGGEVFGNYSGAQGTYRITDATVGTFSSKFQARGSWGLALIPGLRLNDTTLGYVRLGYNWASFKANGALVGVASFSKTNTSNGFNFGVGMETLLVDNWSVRTEYNHTYYNSFNSALGTKFDPSDNTFTVGLVYHFA